MAKKKRPWNHEKTPELKDRTAAKKFLNDYKYKECGDFGCKLCNTLFRVLVTG